MASSCADADLTVPKFGRSAELARQGGTLCKILLGWYQSLVVLTYFPQLQLPADLQDLLTWLEDAFGGILNLNVFEMVPLECLLPSASVSFFLKLSVSMLLLPSSSSRPCSSSLSSRPAAREPATSVPPSRRLASTALDSGSCYFSTRR